MRDGQLVLVSCKIQKGAFSGERIVQLTMADGQGEYIGISPVGHCLGENQAF